VPRHFPVDRFTAYIDTRHNDRVYHNEPHEHNPYYELLYFIEGSSRILIEGREYRAQSGDLVVYYPWTVHEEWVQPGPYHLVCLRFRGRDIERDVPFPGPEALQPVLPLPWKERFRNVFEQIVIENQASDQWSAAMRGAYLTQFVVLLWRALSHCREAPGSDTDEKRARISHVIDLIHSGMRADLSLAALARTAYMSESHFSHTFKDVTGVPPKRYLIESGMARARDLLARSSMSAVAIAAELGYQSPQYFCRLFKKESGMTPLAYRRQARQEGRTRGG